MFVFIAGVLIGSIVTGLAFIWFGKNNKNTIAAARETIKDKLT